MLTTRAAAAEGVSSLALSRAGARGTVYPTGYRGVFSVFPPELLSARDRLQAAWIAIDLTAPPWERAHQRANIVSHHTALDLHAHRPPAEPFEFALGSITRLINRPGIIAHRQPIDADEVVIVDGLPAQTVAAAIVDLMRSYRPHPEQALPRLLAETIAAGADWTDVPEQLGYMLGNPWSKHDPRQVLADLFIRSGANPALASAAILGVDWHQVGFWRIQISRDDNRTAITDHFIDALTHVCRAIADPDKVAGALAADRYLNRFADITRDRVALFDGTRQERIRLQLSTPVAGSARHLRRSAAKGGATHWQIPQSTRHAGSSSTSPKGTTASSPPPKPPAAASTTSPSPTSSPKGSSAAPTTAASTPPTPARSPASPACAPPGTPPTPAPPWTNAPPTAAKSSPASPPKSSTPDKSLRRRIT
ncbi:hypothetical protein [Tsukamurella ocularis]|nr:hypothetical protein [Tsukamurella ocularis]